MLCPLMLGSMNILVGIPLILEVLLIMWTSTVELDSGILRAVGAIFAGFPSGKFLMLKNGSLSLVNLAALHTDRQGRRLSSHLDRQMA